jgi:hypothetical protein
MGRCRKDSREGQGRSGSDIREVMSGDDRVFAIFTTSINIHTQTIGEVSILSVLGMVNFHRGIIGTIGVA